MTSITNLSEHQDQIVTLKGWLYNIRSSKAIHFLEVRDGTGLCQCIVAQDDVSDEVFEKAGELKQESSLEITGKVVKDDRSVGGYELHATDLKVIQIAEEYPITPKEHGVEFLMENRHLWLRSRRLWAAMQVRNAIQFAIHRFFQKEGFIQMDAPVFTGNAAEGTTTLFETDYFDEKAYLTQSGQLYGEAMAMAHGKIYTFGPTFRAEKSKTRRHLTEFWMVEPEVAFADLDDMMTLAERFMVYVVGRALEKHRDLLEGTFERDLERLEKVQTPFPRVHYSEAVRMLNEELDHPFEWGGDFGSPDETRLAEQFDRPFVVHRFPAAIKAFYMEKDPDDEKLSLSMDVLAPEGYGEIIGGGQRAASLDYLEEQIDRHGLPREAFEWYLDLRRYGTFPHAGFGLGLERLVTYVAGINHLRETIPFPRQIHRLGP
jgi:asparaginyl-tRNA synthetase